MSLITQPYMLYAEQIPKTGKIILAQYDQNSIVVYQAYNPRIAYFAVKHQHFGGDFSFQRMSWIKPNFLWMMFRCGWATKENQECILAIRLACTYFDEILAQAVYSSYQSTAYESEKAWKQAVATSDVRLQWDPDHHPSGAKLERRAIQLGLRGDMLKKFSHESIIEIEDITPFVQEQYRHVQTQNYDALQVPAEKPYIVTDIPTAKKLGL